MSTSRFNKRTRLLGWLLALAMLLGLVPVSAFAEGTTVYCQVADVNVTQSGEIESDKIIYGSVEYNVETSTLSFNGEVQLGSADEPCTSGLFSYCGKPVDIKGTLGTIVEGWTTGSGFFMPASISGGKYTLHGPGKSESSKSGIAGISSTTAIGTVIEKDTVVELDGFYAGLNNYVDIKGTVIIRDAAYGIMGSGNTLEHGGKLEVHADTLINGALTYRGGELILDSTAGTDLKGLSISTAEDFWYRTGKDGSFTKAGENFKVPATAYLELTDIDPATGKIYDLWVSDVQVMDANAADVLGDGTVFYDTASNTLTLKNAQFTGREADDESYVGIVTELPKLIITGNADFRDSGIDSEYGDITLRDAHFTFVNDGADGIDNIIKTAYGTLNIEGSEITITGTDETAICAGGNYITISGSTVTVNGSGESYFEYAIRTTYGKLSVEDSRLDLTADTYAVFASAMLVYGEATEIDASASPYAIYLDSEDALTLGEGLQKEGTVNESETVKINNGCAHEYSRKWSVNDDAHWHDCIHCDATWNYGQHRFDAHGVCTVCCYDRESGKLPEDPGEPGGSSSGGSGDGAAVVAAVMVGAAVVGGGVLLANHYIRSNLPEGAAVPATRRELAVALWQMAGCPEPVSQTVYTDLPAEDAETTKAVRWAVENGLLKADSDESFGADAKVNRVEVLRAMLRTERCKG